MLLCGWVWTWVHLDVHLAIFCLRKMYRALGYVSILQSCSILVLKFLNIYMNIYKYTIYWYIYTVCLYIYIYVFKKKTTSSRNLLCRILYWSYWFPVHFFWIPCSPGFPHASFLLCGMQCLGCRWRKSDRWEVGEVFVYLTQIQMKRANFTVKIWSKLINAIMDIRNLPTSSNSLNFIDKIRTNCEVVVHFLKN